MFDPDFNKGDSSGDSKKPEQIMIAESHDNKVDAENEEPKKSSGGTYKNTLRFLTAVIVITILYRILGFVVPVEDSSIALNPISVENKDRDLSKISESKNIFSLFTNEYAEILKSDREKLESYLGEEGRNIPVNEKTQSIIDRNLTHISLLEEASQREGAYCQSSDQKCPYSKILDTARVSALFATLNDRTDNIDEAIDTAKNLISVGQKLAENYRDVESLSLGLELENFGYSVLRSVNERYPAEIVLAKSRRGPLLLELDNLYKKYLNLEKEKNLKAIDIVSSGILPKGEPQELEDYIELSKEYSWNEEETKNLFELSYIIESGGIGSFCDSDFEKVRIDKGLDFSKLQKKDDNYVGKIFYRDHYVWSEDIDKNLCEIKGSINKL